MARIRSSLDFLHAITLQSNAKSPPAHARHRHWLTFQNDMENFKKAHTPTVYTAPNITEDVPQTTPQVPLPPPTPPAAPNSTEVVQPPEDVEPDDPSEPDAGFKAAEPMKRLSVPCFISLP